MRVSTPSSLQRAHSTLRSVCGLSVRIFSGEYSSGASNAQTANEIIASSRAGPWDTYSALMEAGHLLSGDLSQENAVRRLQKLHEDLCEYYAPSPPWKKHMQALQRFSLLNRASHSPIHGAYLHGGVGRGKTMLMDVFFQTSPPIKKLRVHFHYFMLDVHSRLHSLQNSHAVKLRTKDPLAMIAEQLCRDCKLLCLDEVEVTDIADALILHRLFSILWPRGMVLVATSNSVPEDLYKGGLNRSLFEPFFPLLRKYCDTLNLDGGGDYRQGHEVLPLFNSAQDVSSERAMNRAFDSLSEGEEVTEREVEVMMNRKLVIPRGTSQIGRFRFDEICGGALGAADYVALAANVEIVFIDRVPSFSNLEAEDVMRRFITLIDVLYESNKILFCTSDVPILSLFGSHPVESITPDTPKPGAQTTVTDAGGSSGRSTTNIGGMEWSATGLMGASLAKLGSSHESFTRRASKRVVSRLQEMQSRLYLKRNPKVAARLISLFSKQ